MAGNLGAEYNIYDVGFGKDLVRGKIESPELTSFNQDQNPVSEEGFSGGLFDPVEGTIPPQAIRAGELPALIGHGKFSFSDTVAGFLMGLDTDKNYKWKIGNATNSIDWSATNLGVLTIKGSVTATDGTIGGFVVGSDYIRDTANTFGMASTVTGGDDVRFWAGDSFANRATAPFRVTEAGAVAASSFTMTGGSISGIVNSTATDISLLEKTHSITFSVTDADTIAWSSGTISFSNGRTFTISAGNTGNMVALTYIYLDTGVSSTVLQTTTTYSTAIGANKSLIGVAQNNTVTAMFIPYGAGQPLIDGANIGALSIVAANIAASTITAGKLSVSQLSAISADMGAITAGSLTVGTSGFIKSGQSAYNTGAGYYLEYNGGTPRLSIGDGTATNSLTWDGTSLLVNSSPISNNDIYGDGSDGDVTISVDTSLTTDMFYDNLTINTTKTLNSNGFRVFVKGTLTFAGTGKISVAGGAGGNGANASGATGGAGGTAGVASYLVEGTLPRAYAGQLGGLGRGGGGTNCDTTANPGIDGTAVVKAMSGAGSGGGSGGNGSNGCTENYGGGAGGAATGTIFNLIKNAVSAYNLFDLYPSFTAFTNAGGSGSGGGGGGGRSESGSYVGGGGGGGGGSGACGGVILLVARKIVTVDSNTYLDVSGGKGGNGGNGDDGNFADPGYWLGGGGGGGGGGRGGTIILIYSSKTGTGTTSVSGGAIGTGGLDFNGSASGTNGTVGGTGVLVSLIV